jgi:hypothetical protein
MSFLCIYLVGKGFVRVNGNQGIEKWNTLVFLNFHGELNVFGEAVNMVKKHI